MPSVLQSIWFYIKDFNVPNSCHSDCPAEADTVHRIEVNELPVADGQFIIRESMASGHKSLHASRVFREGEVLAAIGVREPLTAPNYLSVQFGEFEHGLLAPAQFQYINHSCAPNIYLDVQAKHLRALCEILPGDELCFFYPSTEWRMSQAFQCHCNTPECLGQIQGAAFLSVFVLSRYELSAHIKQLMRRGITA